MLIGKRINGRYKILEMIGGGGMSTVYLAHDMILNRDVAMKVLRYTLNDEEESHRRFQREALSATSLNHPNIVSIFDVGEDEEDSLQYIVMEYVKGMTLKQYIVEYAPLAPTRCVEIMTQLTSAIGMAHQNQIIHRDIKPQNILMDEDGNVKITDFGIAMALTATSFTKTNSVLGTVHYLSPEQARGGIATKKSDIYSLGIVLYELLTGELPFSGESAVSIALKHLQAETPSVKAVVPSIPQSLENVVIKATAKEVRHRYFTVEKMREDLETVLDESRAHEEKFTIPEDHDATKAMPIIKVRDLEKVEDPDETVIISPEQKEVKPKKKRRKGLWALLILALFVLVAGILFFLKPDLFAGKRIAIPDVSNNSLDDAIDALQTAGFTIGTQTIKTSSDIKEGNVIGTNPEAGAERKKGTEVDIIVSEGKEKLEMSDYLGKNIDQVKTLLSKKGFEKVSVKKAYSKKAIDTVIKQTPEAGEEIIPSEAEVILTISQGEKENIVSNLTGLDETALKTYADSSGFNIKIVDEDYSDDVAEGKVMSQNITVGTSLKVGSTIEVVLSKGQKEKAIKTFVKKIELDFDPEENAEGNEPSYQTVKIYIQDVKHELKDISQEFRIYDDMDKRISLEVEEGTEAAYKVTIDDEVVYNEKIKYEDL
ncbi:serine/threonine-protein kinase PrkC [Kurthia zopfii]|uniref:Serine/threonine-protein kinase PrkC n=1 Tax=Kurthia zopfii TaxID=1650 RepID=A0A8B4Q8Z0_9BACL|nr:Stk1 family PASTA domain-containing Ser/Thr kinase [Kurthia zopfii]PWI22870.1 Stk1 family PASTA domain-containing Ser/Thr kinase [Kurthia zopfii]TDR40166.1 serine/threonine-protein kinase [Kurthia zopfii]GEK30249.1 serine/threonine-protein kinase PrkC [Kurthia zopfii]STX09034.1 Serine/threonine-protein kinase PrkC [Kurthia zopfii]